MMPEKEMRPQSHSIEQADRRGEALPMMAARRRPFLHHGTGKRGGNEQDPPENSSLDQLSCERESEALQFAVGAEKRVFGTITSAVRQIEIEDRLVSRKRAVAGIEIGRIRGIRLAGNDDDDRAARRDVTARYPPTADRAA